MKWKSKIVALFAVALAVTQTGFCVAETIESEEAKADSKPLIEMAILLDTSGSMSGLIHQAKADLWKIVNEFAKVKRDGVRPQLRVALYEYGKSSLPASEGYTRLIVPLTEDLDKLSEELFKLKTNGGQEYCGYVIDQASQELDWSSDPKNLKCIFIAGNEPFTQGDVDFRFACGKATGRNITVSTIFCGDNATGVRTMWAEGAKIADGSYLSIDHNKKEPHIDAPQDDKLLSLSKELNKTYIAFGSASKRNESASRQTAQDTNASSLSKNSAVCRAVTKGSHLYCNSSWDIIDGCATGKIKLEDLKPEQLPEELRKLTIGQLKKHVEKLTKKRKEIQAKIKKLSKAREAFITEVRAKMAADEDDTLDSAIIKAVKKQAEKKGFKVGA